MTKTKSGVDVDELTPVDEVCSNHDVLVAAKKYGYVEFPWSDMGMGEVSQVRNVTVPVPGVGKRQVWVFDLHPLFDLIYQPPKETVPYFAGSTSETPTSAKTTQSWLGRSWAKLTQWRMAR